MNQKRQPLLHTAQSAAVHKVWLLDIIKLSFSIPALHLWHRCLPWHPVLRVEGRSSGAVATQSSVDGWPLRACLTGNRCVSSEDEGPADKHYWRTSAACHNTGRAGATPHPSAAPESGVLGGSILGCRARSPITHPGDAGYVGCMFGPPACFCQTRAAFGRWRRERSSALEKCLTLTPLQHTHTHTHTHIYICTTSV